LIDKSENGVLWCPLNSNPVIVRESTQVVASGMQIRGDLEGGPGKQSKRLSLNRS
jgi:hypothetical protein